MLNFFMLTRYDYSYPGNKMNDALLPFDILTLIPSHFLSIRDVTSFSLVCKKWHEAILCSEINVPVIIKNKDCNWNLHLSNVTLEWTTDDIKYIVKEIKQNDLTNRAFSTIKRLRMYIKSDMAPMINEFILYVLKNCHILQNVNIMTNRYCYNYPDYFYNVNFSGCSLLTDDIIRTITTGHLNLNLHSIDFSDCVRLTDEAVKSVSSRANLQLQRVNFTGCHLLTDQSVKYISECPNLKCAVFSFCDLLTDQAIKYISECPNLECAIFCACNLLTNIAIESISKCPNLRRVNFRRCILLTDEAIESISKCPNLERAWFHECPLLTEGVRKYANMHIVF